MGIQELIVGAIVLVAAFFSVRGFYRQFSDGDAAAPKCSKCELGKAVLNQNQSKKQ